MRGTGPVTTTKQITSRTAGKGSRVRSRVPAVQHRAALDAELRRPCGDGRPFLPRGETVFAGQRNDGFFVDLGAIFDLGDIRELQNLHLISDPRRRASTR